MCCGVMLLLLIIYIYIYIRMIAYYITSFIYAFDLSTHTSVDGTSKINLKGAKKVLCNGINTVNRGIPRLSLYRWN